MGTTVLFVLCIIFGIAQSKMDDIARNKIAHECLKETGLDVEVVEQVIKTATLPHNNQLYKDFLFCSYKKQGYQNEQGDILHDNIKEFLLDIYTQSEVDQIVDPCKNATGTNATETTFKTIECLLPKLKRLG